MLMKTMKIVGDTSVPDEIERETRLKVGDKFLFEYDWCKKKSCINGYRRVWHKDVAEVEVVDIKCNMLVEPSLVIVFMKTENKTFIERCRCNEFDATEEQVFERMRH